MKPAKEVIDMAEKEEKSDEVKHKVILIRLHEGPSVGERLALSAINYIGGIVTALGAVILFFRLM